MEKTITKEQLTDYMLKLQKMEEEGTITEREFKGYCTQLEVLFTDMYDECAWELNEKQGRHN
jgi:hypothetical protein